MEFNKRYLDQIEAGDMVRIRFTDKLKNAFKSRGIGIPDEYYWHSVISKTSHICPDCGNIFSILIECYGGVSITGRMIKAAEVLALTKVLPKIETCSGLTLWIIYTAGELARLFKERKEDIDTLSLDSDDIIILEHHKPERK